MFLTVSALLLSLSLNAQTIDNNDNLGVAVVVGHRHAWMLEAPEGWSLDVAGARSSQLGAAFRPSDQSWSRSPAVMYANSILKEDDSINLRSVIAGDAERAEQRLPRTEVVETESIGTIQGVDAVVRHYVRSDSSLCEAVAYIDGPTVVALVVLSARSGQDFRSSLKAFARLVDSYEWITSDPESLQRTGQSR